MFLLTFLLIFLMAVYGALIGYYHRAWNAIPEFERVGSAHTMITVLVPARNEESNIGVCLNSLSRQSYPADRFEVIVIDDHSTDGTAAMVRNYRERMQLKNVGDKELFSLSCLDLALQSDKRPVTAHKKWAIETGIHAATGDLIVTTDADCQFPVDWLKTLAEFFETTGAKFIAAPVRIGGRKTAFLSIFQTLDFLSLQGITGAAVHNRFHSMCNGANLAYEKKAFFEVGGFAGIDAIPSGDDMLLMHKIYRKYPEQVLYLKSRHAIVDTKPELSWKGFVHQRLRWASKAGRYDDRRIFWVLLLVYFVNALFVGLLVAACWNAWWLWVAILLLIVKTAIEFPFVRSVARFFGQSPLLAYFPWLQPFHIVYTTVIGLLGPFGRYQWKGRKISAL